MPKRKRGVNCWHVVSFSFRDRRRIGKRNIKTKFARGKPDGFVMGTYSRKKAISEAKHLKSSMSSHNVDVMAYSCNRASKLFDLKV